MCVRARVSSCELKRGSGREKNIIVRCLIIRIATKVNSEGKKWRRKKLFKCTHQHPLYIWWHRYYEIFHHCRAICRVSHIHPIQLHKHYWIMISMRKKLAYTWTHTRVRDLCGRHEANLKQFIPFLDSSFIISNRFS